MDHLPLTTIVVPERYEMFSEFFFVELKSDDKKTYPERIFSTIIDIWNVLIHPTDPLVEISFVVTVEIGQMNFEPA